MWRFKLKPVLTLLAIGGCSQLPNSEATPIVMHRKAPRDLPKTSSFWV